MSLGSLGSIAGTPITQSTSADVDRIKHDSAAHSRESSSQRITDQAAGIGATEQEQGANERDADGRRMWEFQGPTEEQPKSTESQTGTSQSKDPTGERGANIDLSG